MRFFICQEKAKYHSPIYTNQTRFGPLFLKSFHFYIKKSIYLRHSKISFILWFLFVPLCDGSVLGNRKWIFFFWSFNTWRENDTSRCPSINKTLICLSGNYNFLANLFLAGLAAILKEDFTFIARQNFKFCDLVSHTEDEVWLRGETPRGKRYMETAYCCPLYT